MRQTTHTGVVRTLTIAGALAFGANAARAQATFQGLGFLNAGAPYSRATGVAVMENEVIVTGYSTSDNNGPKAFRWTPLQGMVELNSLPGLPGSEALGISADGQTIAG